MYLDPYETMACRFYQTKEISKEIKEAELSNEIIAPISPDGRVLDEIKMISPENETVSSFSHPMKVSLSKGEQYVIDARPFLKIDKNKEIVITNEGEYKLLLIRALLNLSWEEDNDALLTVGDFPKTIFTRWLSGNISNRLGLNPEEQVKVTTVTLFYYYSLHSDDEFSENDKVNIIKKLTKVSYIPMDVSMKLIDDVGLMKGIQEYIDTIKEIVPSPRIDNLNVGLLLTILSNSWFGFNAKELIATALEHPPTFLAIVNAALESRSYRKSYLGKLVYDNDKRGAGNEFQKSIYHLVYR